MLIVAALVRTLMLAQSVVSATPQGAALNPALIYQHPEWYLERDLSLAGSLYECDGAWCLTSVRIQAPNGLRLQFATPALIDAFQGTSYVPRREGPFWYSSGCEVRAVGILVAEPERSDPYFLHVLTLSAEQEHLR